MCEFIARLFILFRLSICLTCRKLLYEERFVKKFSNDGEKRKKIHPISGGSCGWVLEPQ